MDSGLRESEQVGRRQRTEDKPKSKLKGFLIAAALVVGVGVVGNDWIGPDVEIEFDDQSGIVDRDSPRGAVTIEADQLFQAYRDDPGGSAERFGGREMVVSGEFVRIVPDGFGSLDLRLKTSFPGEEVGVDLADLAIEDGKKLLPGQRVTVSCQGMGEGGEELWVRECAIQPTADTPAAPETAADPAAAAPTGGPAGSE